MSPPLQQRLDSLRAIQDQALTRLFQADILAKCAIRGVGDFRREFEDSGREFWDFPNLFGSGNIVGSREHMNRYFRDTHVFQMVLSLAVSGLELFVEESFLWLIEWIPESLSADAPDPRVAASIQVQGPTGKENPQKQVERWMRKSPADYFATLQERAGISIPSERVDQFGETKATRDTIVHNRGVADSRYERKAGRLARAQAGELLTVDQDYFERSLRSIDELVREVFIETTRKHAPAESAERCHAPPAVE